MNEFVLKLTTAAFLICPYRPVASILENEPDIQNKNPAFLSEKDQPSYNVSYKRQLVNSPQSLNASVSAPSGSDGLYGTFCISHQCALQDGLRSRSNRIFVSYAQNAWSRLSYGFNVGGTVEMTENIRTTNIDFDLGVSYRLINHPFFGKQIAGVAVQNILTPSRRQGKWHTRLMNIVVSWYADLFCGRVQPGFDVRVSDLMADATDLSYTAYLGYSRFPFNVIVLAGDDSAGLSAGIFLPIRNCQDVLISTQYKGDTRNKMAGQLCFNITADFGKNREANYSRKMGIPTCGCSINDIYIKACNLYAEGNYFDAFSIFSEITNIYQDFSKKDWCSYFIADCLRQMGMLIAAHRNFNQTILSYTNNKLRTFCYIGLLKTAIEQNTETDVAAHARKLFSSHISDSIKQEINFLIADYRMTKNDYVGAQAEYSKVSPKHPKYIAAQYSIAAINRNLHQDDNAAKILSKLTRRNALNAISVFTLPDTVDRYNAINVRARQDWLEIGAAYDSLEYSLEELFRARVTEWVIHAIDSLHIIQKNYYETVERYRLMNNQLFKKWLFLGNDLLYYLDKNELLTIELCLKLMKEYQ